MQCSQKVGQKKWSHNSSQKTCRTSTPTPPLRKDLLTIISETPLDYARASIQAYQSIDAEGLTDQGTWPMTDGVTHRVRRGAVGVVLFLTPFNYPLNEMYP